MPLREHPLLLPAMLWTSEQTSTYPNRGVATGEHWGNNVPPKIVGVFIYYCNDVKKRPQRGCSIQLVATETADAIMANFNWRFGWCLESDYFGRSCFIETTSVVVDVWCGQRWMRKILFIARKNKNKAKVNNGGRKTDKHSIVVHRERTFRRPRLRDSYC